MTTPFTPRRYGNDSGDRILANLTRAAEASYAKRRYVLSDEQYADVLARRAKREPWKAIAADYGISHTTLMNAVARYRAAARKLMRETNQ